MSHLFIKFFKNEFFISIITWISLLLILLIVADKMLLPWIAGQNRKTVTIPLLIGLDPEKAESLLDDLNLNVEWSEKSQYSLTIAEGKVMSQIPQEGHKVKEGRTIKLVKSQGLKQIEMPNLEGRTKKDAELMLSQIGLYIKGIEDGSHTTLPRNSIIRTIPEAGTGIRTGDSVVLVVCKSSQGVMVPPLDGKTLEEAQILLENANLRLGDIRRKTQSDAISETIIEQNPKAGERLKAQSSIQVTVAE